ncbi:MAG TPA: hypothetical protein VHW65_04355 [Gemmatimonadales bacterium]|jgi:hypothetical protein|nr:hypothetical protein [Gemmatimonadales bacterium]
MAPKLSSRQKAQLAWLETLPRKFERVAKVIELLAVNQADESQVRGLTRVLDELKAQGSGVGLTVLADSFGYMGMLLRRGGGHQTKVRGLQEMLAGARTNFEGAMREVTAGNPTQEDTPDAPDDVSP